MRTSPKARAKIAEFEGTRYLAYQDQNGVWTIGVGHTAGVKQGDKCTPAQSDAWLAHDLQEAEGYVSSLAHVPLTQNRFDALVSFVFNEGAGRFARSQMLADINKGDFLSAASEFVHYATIGIKQSGPLLRRRLWERDLFAAKTEAV